MFLLIIGLVAGVVLGTLFHSQFVWVWEQIKALIAKIKKGKK